MMKQCETCLMRECKDDLICCQSANLGFEFRKLLKSIPLIGEIVPDYECKAYEYEHQSSGKSWL